MYLNLETVEQGNFIYTVVHGRADPKSHTLTEFFDIW